MAPRKGLELELMKMGRAGPPLEPRRRPQAGKSGDPRSQNTDSDNSGAIALAKESKFHKRTKHIKRRINSICHQVSEGDIENFMIHTDLSVADPLSKPLPRAKHDQHQGSMGVRIITV